MADSRIAKHADILVNYSVEVQNGDKVAICGSSEVLPLIRECYRAVLEKGGIPILRIEDEECEELFYSLVDDERLDYYNPIDLKHIEYIDKEISIWGDRNNCHLSQVPPEKIARSMQAQKPIDDVWNHRTCAVGKPEFLARVGTLHPCNSSAQAAGMSLREYENFVYNACKLNLEDPIRAWKKEQAKQEIVVEFLNQFDTLRFMANKTDITFQTSGRKWRTCAGKENFPDGEVYTAPIETVTDGEVFFSFPNVYHGVEVGQIYLKFRAGLVVEAKAEKNNDYLYKMITQDEGASRVGELAFGLNEDVKIYTKDILFDEKIGGTFHLALGDAYANTGGKNKSQLHWDMICDLRNEGNVYGSGEYGNNVLIQSNGKWIFDEETATKYWLVENTPSNEEMLEACKYMGPPQEWYGK